MDIETCDEVLVARLVERGLVLDVADLYRLAPAEVASLGQVDLFSAGRIFQSLEDSRHRDWWRLVLGLGIPGVGPESSRALGTAFRSLDDLRTADLDRIRCVEGVAEEVAQGVFLWMTDSRNRRLLERLRRAGLDFGYARPSG